MILDEFAEFADNLALVAGTGTQLFGDVIDTHVGTDNTLQNLGATPIYLVIQAVAAIVGGTTDETLEFQLCSDSTADLATAPTVHLVTGNFDEPVAAGTVIYAGAIPSSESYQQFLGLRQVVSGTTGMGSSGGVNAFLTLDAQVWTSYANRLAALP